MTEEEGFVTEKDTNKENIESIKDNEEETKKENKQPALNIKEDKEETEDCSKIGETVNNDEDPERTITEDDIITENNNEEEEKIELNIKERDNKDNII